MSQREIRLLSAADTTAFRELRLEGLRLSPTAFGESEREFASSSTESITQRIVGENNRAVGLFVAGKLVGVAVLSRMRGEKCQHRGLIWGVYVQPQFRGRGFAREIMRAALAEVPSFHGPSLAHLSLKVARGNDAAFALYKGLGFEECGVEPEALLVDGNLVDEILMIFRLS